MLKISNLIASLDEAEEAYDKATTKVAEEFLTEVIVPFCKKHNLSFVSGMGSYHLKTYRQRHISFEDLYVAVDVRTNFQREVQEIDRMIDKLNDVTKFLGWGFDFNNPYFKEEK